MASPATTNFLTAWRSRAGSKITLVKLELTDPSAVTFRWGSSETNTPDQTTWETGLHSAGPISVPGELLDSEVHPCTCPFEFIDRRMSSQAAALTLSDTLSSHRWHGAYITAYRWHTALTAWADALQVYKGQVFEFQLERGVLSIRTMQRMDWNRRLPVEEVRRG
jgi:hypothetical protein